LFKHGLFDFNLRNGTFLYFNCLSLNLYGALLILHPADADKMASTFQAKLPKLVGQRTNFLVKGADGGGIDIFSTLSLTCVIKFSTQHN
jgi:hypothetical protein